MNLTVLIGRDEWRHWGSQWDCMHSDWGLGATWEGRMRAHLSVIILLSCVVVCVVVLSHVALQRVFERLRAVHRGSWRTVRRGVCDSESVLNWLNPLRCSGRRICNISCSLKCVFFVPVYRSFHCYSHLNFCMIQLQPLQLCVGVENTGYICILVVIIDHFSNLADSLMGY